MGTGYVNLSGDAKRTLQDIACLAYGSGKNEGKLGGEGRMGICDVNGKRRVIKFNTHWYERWAPVSAADYNRMKTSSDNLRAELLETAKVCCENYPDGRARLKRIKVALGYQDADGAQTQPKGLLDRKVVAGVLTEIGGPELWKDALWDKGDMKSYATLPLEKTNYDAVLSAQTDTPHARELREGIKSYAPDVYLERFKDDARMFFAWNQDVHEKFNALLDSEGFKDAFRGILRTKSYGVMSENELRRNFNRCLVSLEKIFARSRVNTITGEMLAQLLASPSKYLSRCGYSADHSDAESLQAIGLDCADFDFAVKDYAKRFKLDAKLVGNCVLKYITSAVRTGLLTAGDGAKVLDRIKSGACSAANLAFLAEGRDLPASIEGQSPLISGKLHKALLAGRSPEEVSRLAGFLPALEKNSGDRALSPIVLGALIEESEELSRIQSEKGRLTIVDICKVLVPNETVVGTDPRLARMEALNLEDAIVDNVADGDLSKKQNLSALVQTYGLYPGEAAEILSGNDGQGKLLDLMKDGVLDQIEAKNLPEKEKTALLSNLTTNLPKLLAAYAGTCRGGDEDTCKLALEKILCRPEMREQRRQILMDLCQTKPAEFDVKLNAARLGNDEEEPEEVSLQTLCECAKANGERTGIVREANESLGADFGWMRDLLRGDPLLSADAGIGCSPLMLLNGTDLSPLNGKPAYLRYRLTMLKTVQDAIRANEISQGEVTAENLQEMLMGDFSSFSGEQQTKLLNRASAAIVKMLRAGFEYRNADKEIRSAADGFSVYGIDPEVFDQLVAAHVRTALRSNGGFRDADSLNEFVGEDLVGRNVGYGTLGRLAHLATDNFDGDELKALGQGGFDLFKVLNKDERFSKQFGVSLFKVVLAEIREKYGEIKGREDEVIRRMQAALAKMTWNYNQLFIDNKMDEELKPAYSHIYNLVCLQNLDASAEETFDRFVAVRDVFEELVEHVATATGCTDKGKIRALMMPKVNSRRGEAALQKTIASILADNNYGTKLLTSMKEKIRKLKEVDDLFEKAANSLKNTEFDGPGVSANILRNASNFDLMEAIQKEPISDSDGMAFDVESAKKRLNWKIDTAIPHVKTELAKKPGDPAHCTACKVAMYLLFNWSPSMLDKADDIDSLIDLVAKWYSDGGIGAQVNDLRDVLNNPDMSDADKANAVFDLMLNAADSNYSAELWTFLEEHGRGSIPRDVKDQMSAACVWSVLNANTDVREGIGQLFKRIDDSGQGKFVQSLSAWAKGRAPVLLRQIKASHPEDMVDQYIANKELAFVAVKAYLRDRQLLTAEEGSKIDLNIDENGGDNNEENT